MLPPIAIHTPEQPEVWIDILKFDQKMSKFSCLDVQHFGNIGTAGPCLCLRQKFILNPKSNSTGARTAATNPAMLVPSSKGALKQKKLKHFCVLLPKL
jgi:hypothetical protein